MGKRKGRGKSAKQAQRAALQEPEDLKQAPHTFVIYRGKVGKYTSQLVRDFRKVLEPFTASSLKVQKRNVIRDFVSVAGLLHVTHLIVFTKTDIAINLKIAKLPRGPTLTFRIKQYCLSRDVLSSLRKQITYATQFLHHPLLTLNNLSGDGMHLKLIASMFQNMFPSININTVKLNTIRRCILLNYDAENETFDFRHYAVKVMPTGVSKPVKKLIQSKIPNLSQYEDVSEFVIKSGNLSESEAEPDGPENEVVLTQNISSRGNMVTQQSGIRLTELGPRLTLQLIKIEEGLMEGEVIFHKLIEKTKEEIEYLKKQSGKRKRLKLQRKQQQEMNKKLNERTKERRKNKLLKIGKNKDAKEESESDNDAEWFEKEVGQQPEEGTFSRKRKASCANDNLPKKRRFFKDGGKLRKQTKAQPFQQKPNFHAQKNLRQRSKMMTKWKR